MALGDGTIRVISAAPIEDAAFGPLFEVPHTGPVLAAGYSPDGMRLATVEADEGPGRPVRIRVMDAADGRVLSDIGLIGSRVTAVAFGPDGERFAAVDADGSVMLRDVANGQALHMLGKVKANHTGLQSGWPVDRIERRRDRTRHQISDLGCKDRPRGSFLGRRGQ